MYYFGKLTDLKQWLGQYCSYPVTVAAILSPSQPAFHRHSHSSGVSIVYLRVLIYRFCSGHPEQNVPRVTMDAIKVSWIRGAMLAAQWSMTRRPVTLFEHALVA